MKEMIKSLLPTSPKYAPPNAMSGTVYNVRLLFDAYSKSLQVLKEGSKDVLCLACSSPGQHTWSFLTSDDVTNILHGCTLSSLPVRQLVARGIAKENCGNNEDNDFMLRPPVPHP